MYGLLECFLFFERKMSFVTIKKTLKKSSNLSVMSFFDVLLLIAECFLFLVSSKESSMCHPLYLSHYMTQESIRLRDWQRLCLIFNAGQVKIKVLCCQTFFAASILHEFTILFKRHFKLCIYL